MHPWLISSSSLSHFPTPLLWVSNVSQINYLYLNPSQGLLNEGTQNKAETDGYGEWKRSKCQRYSCLAWVTSPETWNSGAGVHLSGDGRRQWAMLRIWWIWDACVTSWRWCFTGSWLCKSGAQKKVLGWKGPRLESSGQFMTYLRCGYGCPCTISSIMSDFFSPNPTQMKGENVEVFRWVRAKRVLIRGKREEVCLHGGNIYWHFVSSCKQIADTFQKMSGRFFCPAGSVCNKWCDQECWCNFSPLMLQTP